MNIKKIEIYSESGKFDRTIKKAIVYYEDSHDVKLDDIEDIKMAVAKFLKQEHMEPSDLKAEILKKDSEKFQVIKYEKLEEFDDDKEEKKGKKWLNKPLVCLGTVVVLTFVGSNLFQKGNDYSSKRTGTPEKTITQKVNDLPINDTDTSDKYVSVGNDYYVKLDEFKNRTQKTELYKNVQAYLNGSNKTEDNLYWILSGISDNCNLIIHQMNEYVDGNKVTSRISDLNLSSMFEENDINYAVCKKFEDMCNNIGNLVEEDKRNDVINAYRNFYNLFIDFIYHDTPITINGGYARFYNDDVSGIARDYILAMGQLLLQANIKDYSAMIGRNVYNIEELRPYVASTFINLEEILYESVSSKSY